MTTKITDKAMKNHPGLNPNYFTGMADRKKAQAYNREAREHNRSMAALGVNSRMPMIDVPKQPNRYLPHYGAKEADRYANRSGGRK